ncbi:MAG: peptidylprolyl isomerase [Gemmataceae bacterium]
MLSRSRFLAAFLAVLVISSAGFAQEKKQIKVPKVQLPPAPSATAVAATVNGEPVMELAVYRALSRIPPTHWDKARSEVVNYLIENTLIDQYLELLPLKIDSQQVEARYKQLCDEIKKNDKTPEVVFKKFFLTPKEIRANITGSLRWEAFTKKYAGEEKLKEMFTKHKEMFDGSLVRARHLLLKAETKTQAAAKTKREELLKIRQQIEAEVAKKVSELPPSADKLTREKTRRKALEEVFSATAKKFSDCPSKQRGGDLDWFPRLGKMVEPFANAAFALKTYQMSSPVMTEFGYHLILPIDRKAGRDVKYDQVKDIVKEVYAERLREAILRQMRPRAKISIAKAK